MKRELKLTHVKGGSNQFRITKQTHREGDFAPSGNIFRASNGVRLASISCPEYDSADQLFVRGDTPENDRDLITIPKEAQHRILAAVREYNRKAGSTAPFITATWADRSVKISKKELTVGCSTFSIKDFYKLVKMVDKVAKPKPTGK